MQNNVLRLNFSGDFFYNGSHSGKNIYLNGISLKDDIGLQEVLKEKGADIEIKGELVTLSGDFKLEKDDLSYILDLYNKEQKELKEKREKIDNIFDAAKFGFKEHLDNFKENINEVNFKGETPLIVAIESGNLDVANALIEMGADVSKKNNQGLFPLLISTINNFDKLSLKLVDSIELSDASIGIILQNPFSQCNMPVVKENSAILKNTLKSYLLQRGFSEHLYLNSNVVLNVFDLAVLNKDVILAKKMIDKFGEKIFGDFSKALLNEVDANLKKEILNHVNKHYENMKEEDINGILDAIKCGSQEKSLEYAKDMSLINRLFWHSVIMNNEDYVIKCIDLGADCNKLNDNGISPLLMSTIVNNKNISLEILDRTILDIMEISIVVNQPFAKSPLNVVSQNSDVLNRCFDKLNKNGKSISNLMLSPLDMALLNKDKDLMKAIINKFGPSVLTEQTFILAKELKLDIENNKDEPIIEKNTEESDSDNDKEADLNVKKRMKI